MFIIPLNANNKRGAKEFGLIGLRETWDIENNMGLRIEYIKSWFRNLRTL